MIRDPEFPMACPSATAPPLTLIFFGSISRIFSAALTTTEKASLISNRVISSLVKPAFFRAAGIATVGASGKSIGLRAASAYARGRVELHLKVGKVMLTDDLCQWLDAKLLSLGSADEYQCTGTIIEVRRIGGSDNAIRLEDGFEGRNLVKLDLLVFLIFFDNSFATLERYE